MKKYFIYYHCDQWKMKDSMETVGVFDEPTLRQIIIEDLVKGVIELDKRTDEEILSMDIWTINSLIEFGHVEEITINERL